MARLTEALFYIFLGLHMRVLIRPDFLICNLTTTGNIDEYTEFFVQPVPRLHVVRYSTLRDTPYMCILARV